MAGFGVARFDRARLLCKFLAVHASVRSGTVERGKDILFICFGADRLGRAWLAVVR